MLTVEKKTETSDLWQILEFFFCIMEVISTLKMVSKKISQPQLLLSYSHLIFLICTKTSFGDYMLLVFPLTQSP